MHIEHPDPNEDPNRAAFEQKIAYLPPGGQSLVMNAYDHIHVWHAGRPRSSGELEEEHLRGTAEIVAGWGMDADSVAAALIHDSPEDLGIPLETIGKLFNLRVATLVDGVTKARTRRGMEKEAETQLKLFTTQDIRVVMIKLADRLFNMRDIWPLYENKPNSAIAMATNTLEVLVPAALLVGKDDVADELRHRAVEVLHYKDLARPAKVLLESDDFREYTLNTIALYVEDMLTLAPDHPIVTVTYRPFGIADFITTTTDGRPTLTSDIPIRLRAICETAKDLETVRNRINIAFTAHPQKPGQRLVAAGLNRPVEIEVITIEELAVRNILNHIRVDGKGERLPPGVIGPTERYLDLSEYLEMLAQIGVRPEERLAELKKGLTRLPMTIYTERGEPIPLEHGSTVADFAARIHMSVFATASSADIYRGEIRVVENAPLNRPLSTRERVVVKRDHKLFPQGVQATFEAITQERSREVFKRLVRRLLDLYEIQHGLRHDETTTPEQLQKLTDLFDHAEATNIESVVKALHELGDTIVQNAFSVKFGYQFPIQPGIVWNSLPSSFTKKFNSRLSRFNVEMYITGGWDGVNQRAIEYFINHADRLQQSKGNRIELVIADITGVTENIGRIFRIHNINIGPFRSVLVTTLDGRYVQLMRYTFPPFTCREQETDFSYDLKHLDAVEGLIFLQKKRYEPNRYIDIMVPEERLGTVTPNAFVNGMLAGIIPKDEIFYVSEQKAKRGEKRLRIIVKKPPLPEGEGELHTHVSAKIGASPGISLVKTNLTLPKNL